LVHKTERQGVELNLNDEAGVRRACRDLSARLGPAMSGILVQRMVPDGVEMLVGATVDPLFGPMVVCASGGILVDLVGDSSLRLAPVSHAEAEGMIDGLKGTRLLRGYRGAPPSDEPALCRAVEQVSALVDACPDIVELDINPLMVLAVGVSAVDVRVRVRRPRSSACMPG
jgi:acyl-CoA synthetase (NDP forming)